MSEKRKGSASPSPEARAKRQRLDVPVRSSSSGLSSLESDEEPLATSATAAKTSGKMVSAIPSRLLPENGSMAPSDSEASSPEPQPKHHPSGKTSNKSRKSKTSQKGQGMARTVGPATQMPSSPDTSLSAKQARSSPIKPVKQEELDSAQVTLVTAGVSIDAEDLTMQTAFTKERPAISEEKAGIIEFRTVSSEDPTAQNFIILTGLKNIFQRQLPKMPREYIARLVFDRNHISMAIVKHGLQVVGGITYRPFQQRAFAEIVFCAITGTEQVRGYGNHLMNHLKDFVRSAHPGIEYFLTYADNYAVGYFKKQGFTKEITLERELWAAYIKDYEGGTLMQCSMLPRIKYLQARETLMGQREAILAKIRQMSKSHVVYSGRDIFPEGVTSVDPSTVPGLRDLNWNPAMDELSRRPQRGPHFMMMQRLLTDMQGHASAWPFLRPVNRDEVADYYEVIKEPMDLETMETKLEANMYDDMPAFMADAQRIFNNCRMYNSETSNYVKNANKLEKFLNARAKEIAP